MEMETDRGSGVFTSEQAVAERSCVIPEWFGSNYSGMASCSVMLAPGSGEVARTSQIDQENMNEHFQ
jgi:hypothetical protein